MYPIGIALHPYMPERLGFSRLVRLAAPDLANLLQATDRYTLVPRRNRVTLWREARRILRAGVPGSFVEFGVHRGGTAAVLATVLSGTDRTLHLFDRWGDLPDTTDKDGFRADEYRREQIPDKLARLKDHPPLPEAQHVIHTIARFPVERTRYWEGWFNETFPQYDGGPIAFASVDCDYYESVRDSLAFLGPRLSPGATIVLDDHSTWPGVKAAADEWLAGRNARLYQMPTGPAVIRLL